MIHPSSPNPEERPTFTHIQPALRTSRSEAVARSGATARSMTERAELMPGQGLQSSETRPLVVVERGARLYATPDYQRFTILVPATVATVECQPAHVALRTSTTSAGSGRPGDAIRVARPTPEGRAATEATSAHSRQAHLRPAHFQW